MIICEVTIRNEVRTFSEVSAIPHVCEALKASDNFQATVMKEFSMLKTDPLCGSKMLIGGSETFKMFKSEEINEERFKSFTETYFRELEASISPETHLKSLDDTYHRMIMGIVRNSFNKDSEALKATCKVLKVKHTYKAIAAYLKGE